MQANANYPGKTRDLANPLREADLMERTLRSLGFTVFKKVNLTPSQIDDLERRGA